jgi:hypothetical protein
MLSMKLAHENMLINSLTVTIWVKEIDALEVIN